jgi:hypothetical protein
MPQRDFFLSLSTVVCVLGVSACAAPASNLQSEMIGSAPGAAFGRVQAFIDEQDVTKDCNVYFAERSTSKPGPVYLSSVECNGRKLIRKNLSFDVPGGGEIAYFGHIRADFQGISGPVPDRAGAIVLGGIIGGAVGAAVSPTVGIDLGTEIANLAPAPSSPPPDGWYRVRGCAEIT